MPTYTWLKKELLRVMRRLFSQEVFVEDILNCSFRMIVRSEIL